jgi:hypothetical protein
MMPGMCIERGQERLPLLSVKRKQASIRKGLIPSPERAVEHRERRANDSLLRFG